MKSQSPPISGSPAADRNMQMAVEAHQLERLMPQFFDPKMTEVAQFLTPRARISRDVTEVSFTLPEVASIWFNSYTGAEPSLNFPDVVKGIGCVSVILEPDQLPRVYQLVEALAKATSAGSDLPRVSAEFADPVRHCLVDIFNNNEPISYRSLLAFLTGAFWLLSFVEDPKKNRGDTSPAGFVQELVSHYGKLAYMPQ